MRYIDSEKLLVIQDGVLHSFKLKIRNLIFLNFRESIATKVMCGWLVGVERELSKSYSVLYLTKIFYFKFFKRTTGIEATNSSPKSTVTSMYGCSVLTSVITPSLPQQNTLPPMLQSTEAIL